MKQMIAGICGLVMLLVAAPGRADEVGTALRSAVSKWAPSIVTIKAVIKAQARGSEEGAQELRLETQGVVVDKDGLVMISNTPFSVGRVGQVMGGAEPGGDPSVTLTPTDFKVTFGDEDKEYNAFLAAKDTKLDVAFLKIEGLGTRAVKPIVFSGETAAAIGDPVVTVSRLRKGYDYAPFFVLARISAELTQPRKAWLVDGGVAAFGLPAFTLSGQPLGVVTTVEPSAPNEENDSTSRFAQIVQMAGGPGPLRAFILPSHTIQAVILQAKKRAEALAAERAGKKG